MFGGWKQNWKFSCKRQVFDAGAAGVADVSFCFFLQCDIPIYSNDSNSNLMPSLVLLLHSLLCYIMSMVLKK